MDLFFAVSTATKKRMGGERRYSREKNAPLGVHFLGYAAWILILLALVRHGDRRVAGQRGRRSNADIEDDACIAGLGCGGLISGAICAS